MSTPQQGGEESETRPVRSAEAVDAMLAARAFGEFDPDALPRMLRHMGFRVRSVIRDPERHRLLTVDLGLRDNLALPLAALSTECLTLLEGP